MKEEKIKTPWWVWLFIILICGLAAMGVQDLIGKIFGE